MALTDKLTSIADAIREKGGTTEKLTLDAMPTAIAALSTGGGEDKVPNPLVYTGDCSYAFYKDNHNWILQNYGDRIQFKDITSAKELFYDNKGLQVYPSITQKEGKTVSWYNAFRSTYAREIGDIINWHSNDYGGMFAVCRYLRYMPNFINPVSSVGASYDSTGRIFSDCNSLREVKPNFMKVIGSTSTSTSSILYCEMFENCYALNEIKNLPVCIGTSALTSNAFGYTFNKCYHLKGITFATQEDGTPYTVQWKKQTIELNKYVGWAGDSSSHRDITTNYNSGITADKEVVSQADYEHLKDDPDWWSRNFAFSRFGHDAAVELINTLPDASAYLATQTGTGNNNIIKFYTNAGNAIDGGSVSALTEEEIAVASAKGWTISYTTST
jgi:hypothetical protein